MLSAADDEFQLPPPGVPVSRRNDPGLVDCELFKALLPHEREEVMKALYPHDCVAGFDGDDIRDMCLDYFPDWFSPGCFAGFDAVTVFSSEPPQTLFKRVLFTC